jgi:hypothetical protein
MGGGNCWARDGRGKKEIAMAVLCRGTEGVDEAGRVDCWIGEGWRRRWC